MRRDRGARWAAAALVLAGVIATLGRLDAQTDDDTLASADAEVRAARQAGTCLDVAAVLEQRIAAARRAHDPSTRSARLAEVASGRVELILCGATADSPPPEPHDAGPPAPRGTAQASLDPTGSTGPGQFDGAMLMRMVTTRRAAFNACYERELRAQPTLAGMARVELTIEESGSVTGVRVTATTVGDVVPACLVRVVRGFRFNPGADGGAATFGVVFQLAITPGSFQPPPAPPPSVSPSTAPPSGDLRDRAGS